MTKPHAIAAIGCLLAVSGCDRPAQSPQPATDTSRHIAAAQGRAPADGTALPLPTDAWIGRWTGPEGLFLDIAAAGERGRYAMTIKGDLDSSGDKVVGIADGDAIRFVRNGVAETLRAANGATTGLKWLADKKNCLVVKEGEGFCRD